MHLFNLEDANGCNSVEFAIANNVDMTATQTMQQTARVVWRLMNTMGPPQTAQSFPRGFTTSTETFGRAQMTGK